MRIKFFRLNREKNLPTPESLRSKIFDVETFWFLTLILSAIILVITILIGFKLFYSQYFETYKNTNLEGNPEEVAIIEKLKKAVEKRDNFINQKISIPRDPSF